MDVLHCRRGWEEDKERIDLLELYLSFVSLGDFVQKSLICFGSVFGLYLYWLFWVACVGFGYFKLVFFIRIGLHGDSILYSIVSFVLLFGCLS